MDDYPVRCPSAHALDAQRDDDAREYAQQVAYEDERERLFDLFNSNDERTDSTTLQQRDRMVERIRTWTRELSDIKADYSDPETLGLIQYLEFQLVVIQEVAGHFAERLRMKENDAR